VIYSVNPFFSGLKSDLFIPSCCRRSADKGPRSGVVKEKQNKVKG
jgi:hypothetical protein